MSFIPLLGYCGLFHTISYLNYWVIIIIFNIKWYLKIVKTLYLIISTYNLCFENILI